MRVVTLLALFLCSSFALFAHDEEYSFQKIEELFPKSDKRPRIMDLWPEEYLTTLPIEPAIPSNFVLRKIPEEINLCGYFLWGPKEVLDACDFNDNNSLTGSIFHLYTSMEMTQTGPKSFSRVDEIAQFLKDSKVTHLSKKERMWGKYPVLTFEGKRPNGHDVCNAWIGMNDASKVLVVKLEVPKKEGRPNEEDKALWQTFLSQTKELPEPDCFLAQGFDMQTGYTHFDPHGEKLTLIAEKRKSDACLQVIIFPRSHNVAYSFIKMEKGNAGTNWRRGDEIVKVFLSVTKKLPQGGSVVNPQVPIPIFVKTVENFSLDKDIAQRTPGVFVLQDKESS